MTTVILDVSPGIHVCITKLVARGTILHHVYSKYYYDHALYQELTRYIMSISDLLTEQQPGHLAVNISTRMHNTLQISAGKLGTSPLMTSGAAK